MPDDEAEVWRTVVDSMPSGFFGGQTHGVLGLYCFHMALAKTAIEEVRELKARLRRGGRPNVEVVASLKHSEVIARRESSQVANLAQKLRITPMGDKVTRKHVQPVVEQAAGRSRPWED